MSSQFVCWKCGSEVDARDLQYRRTEQCATCAADLHVCRMCQHFSARLAGGCSEERAEEVMNKERANFCDYFATRPEAYETPDAASRQRARADLNALFSDPVRSDSAAADADETSAHRGRLDDLFDK